jgi:exopolysaccharide biosynthesis polyprenyl glycosylphosphotransferase
MSVLESLLSQDAANRSAIRDRIIAVHEQRRRSRLIRRRGWLVRRALLVADLLGLTLAFLITETVFGTGHGWQRVQPHEAALLAMTLPVWVLVAKIYGLYDRDQERTDHSTVDDFTGVLHLVTVGVWLVFAGARIWSLGNPSVDNIALFWVSAIALISLARAAVRESCRRHPSYIQNAVIVGAGWAGQKVARKLRQHPEYGIDLVGFVDAGEQLERHPALRDVPVLGTPDDLSNIVLLLDVERVIFAFGWTRDHELLPVLGTLADLGVQIDIVPRYFEIVGPNVDVHMVEGMPMLGLRPARLARSSLLIKRLVDLVGSVAALVLLAPVFVLTALAIKLDSPGPMFFRQVRVGRDNRSFRIWKFRTMAADADERKSEVSHLNKHLAEGGDPRMFKITNDPRVTRVGRILRRYSLDELPQLFNVLVGHMSLVGPRPLIADEHAHIDEWALRRTSLRPGITGPWQVLGRDEIPFEEMVHLDYLYVTNWSLGNDLSLIMRTPGVLAGARAHGSRS